MGQPVKGTSDQLLARPTLAEPAKMNGTSGQISLVIFSADIVTGTLARLRRSSWEQRIMYLKRGFRELLRRHNKRYGKSKRESSASGPRRRSGGMTLTRRKPRD